MSIHTTISLLEKSKLLLEARSLVYQILRDILKHEDLVKDIRHIVDANLSESLDPLSIALLRELSHKLPKVAQ